MSGAFKKKKNGTATKKDKDWPKKKDLGIHTSGLKSWARVASWTHKRKRSQDTRGRRYVHVSNLFNSGELRVTITEILWKRHEWNFPSMLLI